MIDIELNINQVLSQLDITEKEVSKQSQQIFAKAVDLVLTNTINWTPVGNPALWKYPASPFYEPGTLKGSWRATFESPQVATISNETPYALRVEYGWSSQAPEGMLRKSLALLPRFVEKSAEEVDSIWNGKTDLFNSGLYDKF